ncbi:MAG: acyltransferase family protein [Promethearchaeota archaeon]
MKTGRYNSIDIIKGIVLVVMVLSHVSAFWSKWNSSNLIDLRALVIIILFIGNAVGPFFIIVSGTNFFLFVKVRTMKKESKKDIFIQSATRALFIFSISTIIQIVIGQILLKNTFNTQIDNLFYWSIFQTIAVSLVVFFMIPFLRRIYRILFYFIISISVLLLEFIINLFNFEPLLFLVRGEWRFLPYSILFILGLTLGDIIHNISSDKGFKQFMISCLLLGVSFLTIYFPFFDYSDGSVLPHFIKVLGFFFIFYCFIFYFSDIKETNTSIEKSLIRWGKVSFSLYYISWGIVGIGLLVFPFIFPFWVQDRFITIPLLIALLLIFILLEVLLRIWEKFDFIFGLEWVIRKLTPNRQNDEKNLDISIT